MLDGFQPLNFIARVGAVATLGPLGVRKPSIFPLAQRGGADAEHLRNFGDAEGKMASCCGFAVLWLFQHEARSQQDFKGIFLAACSTESNKLISITGFL